MAQYYSNDQDRLVRILGYNNWDMNPLYACGNSDLDML